MDANSENKRKNITGDLPDNEHDLERLKGDNAIFDLPEIKDIPGQEHVRPMPPGEMADTTASSDDEEGMGLLDQEDTGSGVKRRDLAGVDEENSVVIDTADSDEDEEDDDFIEEEDLTEEGNEATGDDDKEDYDDDEDDEDEDDDDYGDEEEDFQEEEEEEEMSAEVTAGEKNLLDQRGPQEEGSDSDNLRRSRLDNTDWEGAPLNESASTRNIAGGDLDVPGAELDDANEEIGEEDEENNLYSESDTD